MYNHVFVSFNSITDYVTIFMQILPPTQPDRNMLALFCSSNYLFRSNHDNNWQLVIVSIFWRNPMAHFL